jgi:quercetin dioxygenase-like cupin family protein
MTRIAFTIALAAALVGIAAAQSPRIAITSNESRPTTRGPADNFTGPAFVDPLFAATDHTRATGGHVTFLPGARSAWHSHPAGQVLIITSGVGWVQEWNGEKRQIKSGDVVWTPPGVKHWHGATSTTSMRHIAIQEVVGGKNVDWMEHVSDEQYAK